MTSEHQGKEVRGQVTGQKSEDNLIHECGEVEMEAANSTQQLDQPQDMANNNNNSTPAEAVVTSENESQPRVRRNRMRNVAQKINQLRMMAKDGRTREVICKELDIDLRGFEYLRRKLNDLDKTYYDIPHVEADRRGRVGKNGIMLSADRLLAMGANVVFAQGAAISIRLEGERILIEPAGTRISSTNPSEPSSLETFVDDLVRDIHSEANSENMEV